MAQDSTEAQQEQQEIYQGEEAVSYEGCGAFMPKGANSDFAGTPVAEKVKQGTLVLDTGAHADFLAKYSDKEELNAGDIDQIYKDTIMAGVVDHHAIDSFLSDKGIRNEKCATAMVADFPETVLESIKEHNIKQVDTHADSDLDAICSAYLAKSLVDHKQLPVMAKELASMVNVRDYGRSEVDSAEDFAEGLNGILHGLRTIYSEKASKEIAEQGFNPAIIGKYENQRNEAMFKILNAVNKAKAEGKDINLDDRIDTANLNLDPALEAEVIQAKDLSKEAYQKFLEDFEQAEKGVMTIQDQEGNPTNANLVMTASTEPLVFINLAYQRCSPDTVVAVFGGAKGKGGAPKCDGYDIGIQPDMADKIDLKPVCLALNKAERKKRDKVYAKKVDERSTEEKALIEQWEGQDDREAFAGLWDRVAAREIDENDILRKDPTPIVANDSLIPASRTSQLDETEFKRVIREFIK